MTHMQPHCNLGCPAKNEITSATCPHGTLCRSPDLRLRHLGRAVRATNKKQTGSPCSSWCISPKTFCLGLRGYLPTAAISTVSALLPLQPYLSAPAPHMSQEQRFMLSSLNLMITRTKCGVPGEAAGSQRATQHKAFTGPKEAPCRSKCWFGTGANHTMKEKNLKQNGGTSSALPQQAVEARSAGGSPYSVCPSPGILWLLLFW